MYLTTVVAVKAGCPSTTRTWRFSGASDFWVDDGSVGPWRVTGALRRWRCLRRSSSKEPLLETDPTRMCELLVGLPDVE